MIPAPLGHALRGHWLLEEGMCFLNHGSFGATPRPVLAAQAEWRERLERQPVRFMQVELPAALRQAAAELGGLLGARGEDLAFVENATAGIATVLHSCDWRPEDEILLSRHAYPAVRNAVAEVCRRSGAVLREARVPFPLANADEIVAAFAEALSPRTRLVITDHVSSPCSVIYPVESLAALCRSRGVALLVDGAHAPGMLELDIASLGADWYVGNCHKWLCAPKGAAFLWAAPARRAGLHPLVVSNRYGEGFPHEFDWTGTRDPSAWLAVPAAIGFLRSLGLERYRGYCRDLALRAARSLAAAWGVALPAPEALLAAMVTLPLPRRGPATKAEAQRLHELLWERHRIEAPVLCFDEKLWVRISGQVYNEPSDYELLARAVAELAAEQGAACPTPSRRDFPRLVEVELNPEPPLSDYREAMKLANAEAARRLAEPMLLSWYDRDRGFESPQHASECDSGLPGYAAYALHRGATLRLDFESGRFVFYFLDGAAAQ